MKDGFIPELDTIAEMVSDWAVDNILRAYNVLTPDGRPFGYVERSMSDRLQDYIALKGNPQAWMQYISESTQSIMEKLSDNGLDASTIASVHPWDIACRYALEYSGEMEDELRSRANDRLPASRGTMETAAS